MIKRDTDTPLLENQDDSTMESDISTTFISERIQHKLKETLQAQSSLPQDDLSIQLSCMQASSSTLLEVKNILDGLDKETIKNVADNIANTDGHFVLQRYLIKSYYLMQSDGSAANIVPEAEVSRSSSMVMFCPLYVAVTEVLTHLLASEKFASDLASTKVLQLLLNDLNVLVLPSPKPDQFRMLLANIQFLWEMSKNPATFMHFRDFSDTVLILINVFVNYQGPFEQLTTLVKSLVMFIAAEVADDETSVYLLAEETCLDFVVDILAKSVSTGEKYLNYQGVYAVDIAKCIENLSRFEGLQEVLLGKGVAELLVSMIQIGDPYDDSAAASALNTLMLQTYRSVDVPVLFQGLTPYCDSKSANSTKQKVSVTSESLLSTVKQEITPEKSDQRGLNVEKEEVQDGRVTSMDKNNSSSDKKEVFSLELPQQSAGIEGNTVDKKGQRKLNAEETTRLEEGQDKRMPYAVVSKKDNMEVLQPTVDIEGNTVDKTGVFGYVKETMVDTEIVTTEIDPIVNETASRKEKSSFQEGSDNRKGTEALNFKDGVKENTVKNTRDESRHEKNGNQICNQDAEIPCDEATTTATVTSTSEVRETEGNAPQVPPEDTNHTHVAEQASYQQDEVSTYLREQLKSMGAEQVKYIQIPAQFNPGTINQPEPIAKCKPLQPERPFQYQQAGTDPVSGQDLCEIHMSLINLGVHNMYDAKLVGLLNQILEETKLRGDGIFDILSHVPDVYSFKMLRTGSMQRQLRVVPAHNQGGVHAPLIHVQPEIDYHLVLKKFVFYVVPDHGSKMGFPGFTFIGPWYENIPEGLEEWSFCFVPRQCAEGKVQYFLSADRLKTNFLDPMLLSFLHMNIQYRFLMAKGESLGQEDLKHHGITVRKIEENGPAVTVHYFYKYLTVDYVLSLRHIQWPSCAAEWPDRQRQWPDSHTIKDVTNYGCHLVPKQPASLSKEDPLFGMFFQYSFARAENILLNKLNDDNPVLTDCLRMLKFLCEMHFDRPQLLKSYHMQTIVLLAAERLPPSHWKADNFVKHLLDLLDDLLHCLVVQNLPNYFIPQQNLLQQFSADFIWDVAVRVSKVRQNPIKYLTPSGDPARFGIYVI